MAKNIRIQIQAEFSKDVQKELQDKLKQIEKDLKIKLDTGNMEESTAQVNKHTKAISDLIDQYKIKEITYKKFQEQGLKLYQQEELSLAQKKRLHLALQSADKEYEKHQKTVEKVAEATNNLSKAEQTSAKEKIKKANGLDILIAKYKLGKVSIDQFNDSTRKYAESQRFQKLSSIEQEKIISKITKVQRDYDKQVNESYTVNKKLTEDRIKAEQDLLKQIQLSTSSLRDQKRNQFLKDETEAHRINNKLLKEKEVALKRIETIQQRIETQRIGKKEVFAKSEVQTELLQLNQMMDSFGKVGGSSMVEINKQYQKFGNVVKSVNYETKKLNKETNNYGKNLLMITKKFLDWLVVGNAVMFVYRRMTDLVTITAELDKQFTNINKVMQLSDTQLQKLSESAMGLAIAMGKTNVEVLEAFNLFAKAGLTQEASTQMTELALLMSNVGDMSAEMASETLIAVNAGYQLNNSYDALLGVLNSSNEIANNNATSIEKLSEAIKVSASTANNAKLSLDEYFALIGTTTSTTQKAGNEVGRAWRTILLRLQGASDGYETLEEDISNAETALKRVDIEVRKNATTFRPTIDVLRELAQEWDNINDIERASIASALAGKQRADALISTMQNWDMVEKQILESTYSFGSAMKENEKILESIESRSKRLTATWEKLVQIIFNPNIIKGWLTFWTKFLEIIIAVQEKTKILLPLLVSLGVYLGLIAGKALLATASVAKFVGVIKTATVALGIKTAGISILVGGLVYLISRLVSASSSMGTFNSAVIDSIKSQTDAIKVESDRIKLVETMTKRLDELAKKEEKTKIETEELKIITGKLNDLYPSLGINVDNLTGKYKDQITELNKLTDAEKESLKSKLKIAQAEAQLAISEAGESGALAKKRKEDADARKILLEQLKNRDPSSITTEELRLAGITSNYSGNARFNSSERIKKDIEKAFQKSLKDFLKFSDQANAYTTAQNVLDTVNDQLMFLMAEEYGLQTGRPRGAFTGYAETPEEEEEDDKKDDPLGTSKPSIPDLLQAERYKTLNSNLDRTRSLFNEISAIISTISDDDEKVVELKERQIELLKLEQSQVHDLAQEQRRRRDGLAGVLSQQGVEFVGTGDDMRIANREAIETSLTNKVNSLRFGDPEVYKIEKSKLDAITKAMDEFFTIQDKELPQAKISWTNLLERIQKIGVEIEDVGKILIEQIKKTRQEQISEYEKGELAIQEIIRKGIDKRKESLDKELKDYKDMVDKKISEKEREWRETDDQKQLESELKNQQELQDQINALASATSLSSIQKRRELEKQLAEQKLKIEDMSEKNRRDLYKQSLQESVTQRELDINDEKRALDEKYTNQEISVLANEALVSGSLRNIKRIFPEVFEEMGSVSSDLYDNLAKYQMTFGNQVTQTGSAIQNTRQEVEKAIVSMKEMQRIDRELASSTVSSDYRIRLQQQDRDKVKIGELQTEFNKIHRFVENGIPLNQSQIDRQKQLSQEAQSIRDKWGWEHQDLMGYKGQFSQGINAGMVTETGKYLLHGSKQNPEYVLTSNQMFNLIKNLANQTFGSTPKPSFAGIGGGMNLSIVVNGNADNSTINGIRNAGKDILREIKDSFKKRGVS
jgi:TP901 family phage tail tape measure protein